MFNMLNNRFNELESRILAIENSSNISPVENSFTDKNTSNNKKTTINNSPDAKYPDADEEFKNNMRDIIREVLQKSDHELKEFLLSKLNDDVYWDKSFNEIKIQYNANKKTIY